MNEQASLTERIIPQSTIEKDGIFVTKEIADKTVWDKLATENPTHAVISAKDEASAAKKSEEQIQDILAHVNSDDVLLDCGTGYGRVAKYLLPKQTLNGYIGVDSAYQMLQLFQQRYNHEETEQQTPLLLLNADIHTLPLKDSSVTVGLVCAVYLHNHKDVVLKATDELKRVLAPGGRALVYSSFPNGFSLMGLQGHSYQMLLNLFGKPFKNGPVRYYSKREVAKLYREFSEVDIIPVGFAVLPKSIIILPRFVDNLWREGIARPINTLLEKITPNSLKPFFALHFDVVATK